MPVLVCSFPVSNGETNLSCAYSSGQEISFCTFIEILSRAEYCTKYSGEEEQVL